MIDKTNTKSSANGHRRRDLEAKQLVRAVVAKLAETTGTTGTTVEDGWALKTAETILAGAPEPPTDPTAYVVAAIDPDAAARSAATDRSDHR